MATNTGVIDLVKPAGNENALISVINSNMDKIDAEAGRARANVAAPYSDSSEYAVGDLCIHQGSLNRCNTPIGPGGESWNAGHWTQVNIAGELAAINDIIGTFESIPISIKSGVSSVTISRNHSCRIGKIVQISIVLNISSTGNVDITNTNVMPVPYTPDTTIATDTAIVDIHSPKSDCRLRVRNNGVLTLETSTTGTIMFSGVYLAREFS